MGLVLIRVNYRILIGLILVYFYYMMLTSKQVSFLSVFLKISDVSRKPHRE